MGYPTFIPIAVNVSYPPDLPELAGRRLYQVQPIARVLVFPSAGTLDLALQASDCDQVHVVHKLRLLSPSHRYYISTAGQWASAPAMSLESWPSGCRTKA